MAATAGIDSGGERMASSERAGVFGKVPFLDARNFSSVRCLLFCKKNWCTVLEVSVVASYFA